MTSDYNMDRSPNDQFKLPKTDPVEDPQVYQIDEPTISLIGDILIRKPTPQADTTGLEGSIEEPNYDLDDSGDNEVAKDSDEIDLKFFGKVVKFAKTARQELKEKSRKGKVIDGVLITTSAAGFVYEQGPWNELVITNLGREVIEKVAQEGNVGLTAIAVTGSLAVWSMLEHTVLGTIMARNLERFPRSIKVLQENFGNSDALENSRQRSLPGKFWNAFSVGSATVNIEDSVTDPDFIVEKKGYKRALGSAALIASGAGIIGGVAGGASQIAINNGYQEQADKALDFISSPFLWTGGFIAFRTFEYFNNRKKRLEKEATDDINVVQ